MSCIQRKPVSSIDTDSLSQLVENERHQDESLKIIPHSYQQQLRRQLREVLRELLRERLGNR